MPSRLCGGRELSADGGVASWQTSPGRDDHRMGGGLRSDGWTHAPSGREPMNNLRHPGPKIGIWVALSLFASTACWPQPSPSSGTQAPITSEPTSAAVASALPSATALPSPSILCEQPQVIENVSYETPTCDAAMLVAIEVLPRSHPQVSSLHFRYGYFCEPGRYCVLGLPPLGHVIATYVDGDRFVVNVRGEDDGRVTVVDAKPFPTIDPLPDPSE